MSQANRLTLHTGYVSQIDPSMHRARVFLPDLNVETYWIDCTSPHTGDSQSYWMPDLKQHVRILADEQLRDCVILGGTYNKKLPPPENSPDLISHKSKDGSEFKYDRSSHKLDISVSNGSVTLSNSGGAAIVLNPDGSITLKASKITVQTGSFTTGGKEIATVDAVDNGGHLIIDRGW